jgi:hypothetical protein
MVDDIEINGGGDGSVASAILTEDRQKMQGVEVETSGRAVRKWLINPLVIGSLGLR